MNLFKTVSLEKAPALLRWSKVFNYLMFVLPVLILFYRFKGLTVGDLFLIQGMWCIFAFLLEIPTGYIGDLFSRKKIIVFSYIAFLLGLLIWYFFSGFWAILIGEFLFAVKSAFYSGTGEAYLYDVLKKQGKEKTYIKETGKIEAWATYGTTFATFTGAAIYKFLGPETTILSEIIFASLAIIIAFYLPNMEDVKRVVEKGKSKIQDMKEIVQYALKHLEIKWLIVFPSVFGAGTFMLMWFMQPIMETNKIPTVMFGVVIGLNQLMRGLIAHHAHTVFKKLKTKNYTVLLYAILFMGLLAALFSTMTSSLVLTYLLLFLIAFTCASQISVPMIMNSMINHRIKSDERATVLSISAMIGQLLSGTLLISVKFIIDGMSLQAMIIFVSPLILLFTFIAMVKLLKLKI